MYSKNLIIFLIILMGFILNVISVQIVGSSFRYLQGALNAGVDQISYVMSASLISEVIIIPFSGWLARLLSPRRLFMISLSSFLIASLGCALASNFYIMVMFRALQGFSGGALMPLMMATIYTLFTPKQIPIILSIAATIGVSSIALGPLIGGFVTENFGWQWMFLYNIPIGIIVLFFAYKYIDLKEKEDDLLAKIDFAGIAFLAIGLITLLVTLEEGERYDWFESELIIISMLFSFICLLLFLLRELTAKNPVIDLMIFMDKNFAIGCINIIVFGITLYVPIFLLPIFLGEVRKLGALEIGVIVSIMGLAWMATGPFVGLLINKIGAKLVVIIGCLLLTLGTFMQTKITSDFYFNELLLPQILKGIGAQFLWIGNQYISMMWVPLKGVQNASAMFNLVLRLGAAISISVASSYLQKLKTSYYGHISQTVMEGRLKAFEKDKLNSLFSNYSSESGYLEHLNSVMLLELYGKREGLIMALNSINYFTMWVAIIPILLLPFVKTK